VTLFSLYAARATRKNEPRATNIKREVCFTPSLPLHIATPLLLLWDRERNSSELIELRCKKFGHFLFPE
jgi:hypothetical protein